MVKANYITGKLPRTASASEVETALQNLPNMGDVTVNGITVTGGETYNITFTSNAGNAPELILESGLTSSGTVVAALSTLANGTDPATYCSTFAGSTPCPELTTLTSPPCAVCAWGL